MDATLSSLILCSAINAPILVFMDDIAKLNMPQTLLPWIAMANYPMFRSKLTTNSTLYNSFYGLITILLCVWNPSINFTLTNTSILAALSLFLIKHVSFVSFILLLLMFLALCMQNIIAYNTHLIYYAAAYILAYVWILRPKSTSTSTPYNYTYVKIIAINVALFLLFLYVRNLTQLYYGGTLLIPAPVSLNVRSSYPLHYVYEYTLSFWVNIDAMPPSYSVASTEYTNVLYGKNLMITYNGAKNSLRTMMKTSTDKVVIDVPDFPLQKWNHILVSYANGVLDFFVNNELIETKNIISEETNEIVVGAENGIKGEICNLLAFHEVLTPEKMNSLYTDFKDKTPPTF